MLDVNAELSGNVSGYFIPYDPAFNLNLFQTFCARYGIKISEEGARDFTEFFEEFRCAPPQAKPPR